MAYAREGAGSQPPPLRDCGKNETFLNFETNRLFFVRSLPKLLCFFCSVQLSNLTSRNFHYDAADAICNNTGSPAFLMSFA